MERSVDLLNSRFRAHCPRVGVGSPQDEAAQQMSYEVFGALLAVEYRTDADAVRKLQRTLMRLSWSNPKVTRHAHSYARSLRELVALQTPDLCGDVRAWSATGFKVVPLSTARFDRHVEAIEGSPLPRSLLTPYLAPEDRALAARDARLYKRLQTIEIGRGQDWWNMTLETLALNQ
jgi:hypothetical protein